MVVRRIVSAMKKSAEEDHIQEFHGNENTSAVSDDVQFERKFMEAELDRSIQDERNNLEDRNAFVGFLLTVFTVILGIDGLVIERLLNVPSEINEEFAYFVLFVSGWVLLAISLMTFLRILTNIKKVSLSLARMWLARQYLDTQILNSKYYLPARREVNKPDVIIIQANSFTPLTSRALEIFCFFISIVSSIAICLTLINIANFFTFSLEQQISNQQLLQPKYLVPLGTSLAVISFYLLLRYYKKRKCEIIEYLEEIRAKFDSI